VATPERLIIEELFQIVDKELNAVPFKLNVAQRILDDGLTGRDIVPKARQEGVSSYVLARFAAVCLTQPNARCVVISHDIPSTQRMLKKVHFILENIRGPKPRIKNASKNEIIFEKTGAMFYIGTAGSRMFGRGDTISHLHCSEYAYWPKPEELLAGLFQAVPKSGEIMIESTGNGVGNDYHNRVMRAAAGRSRFTCHFLPWHIFPEYCYKLTDDQSAALMENLRPEWEEPELIERFGLSAGQLAWRRDKLEEMDYDLSKFKQEYPMTLDECFQASGNSVFSAVTYQPTERWQRRAPGLCILEGHPNINYTYVIGADPSGGTGRDNAAAEIICLELNEQVGEFVNDRVAPHLFAHKLAELGNMFNKALLSVESNNHGLVTVHELTKIYPRNLIHRAFKRPNANPFDESLLDIGVSTTSRSRPMIIASLRRALLDGLVVHSPTLMSELSSFIETDSGKLQAQEGCHDDCVLAAAMATVAMTRATLLGDVTSAGLRPTQRDPFCLEGILDEMNSKRNKLPIAEQVL